MTVHPGPRATLSVLKRNTLATTIMLALLSLTTALVLKPSEAPLPALRLRGGKRLAHARIASSHRTPVLTAPPLINRCAAPICTTGITLDTKTLNTAGALYHGMFGLGLYSDPNCFADSGMSPLKYTADSEGPVGEFTARAFGGMMLAMGSLALFEDAMACEGVTKMLGIAMGLFSPLLFKCMEKGEPSFKKDMWKLQSLLHLPFTALMLFKAFGKKD